MTLREYKGAGITLILLHGGPGAPGHMAPVARELAGTHRVLEPFQRSSSEEPLSVARHVTDLRDLIRDRCIDEPPVLLGSSWGAMLALAYAAAHPATVRALILVGCGTFDNESRAQFQRTLADRIGPVLRKQLDTLPRRVADPDERLAVRGQLLLTVYSYDLLTMDIETIDCDARGHDETWNDMLRLQAAGIYPAAFSAIHVPVLMLHGTLDPHPGRAIADSLRPYLPHLQYHEWDRCGHYPWLERWARDAFFAKVRDWLAGLPAG